MGFVLKHVSKSYDGVQAVKDVSVCVDGKHFVVLAGPSGCGKTTLLHLIAGFLQPDSGTVQIDQEDVTNKIPSQRELAMVFQDCALFPHMSVFDNIVYGVRDATIKKEVHTITAMLGIEHLLERKASNLSMGQQQRVSIARALIRHPKLFLLDEAFSALDLRLKTKLRMELLRLYQQMDATFVYVTHDHLEAMSLADTLIVMKDGEIKQIGTPMELYEHPNDLFVARFLGRYELNVLEAKIEHQQLVVNGITIPIMKEYDNQAVYVGIRPESITICEKGYQGVVIAKELLGDEVYYRMQWNQEILHVKAESSQLYDVNQFVCFTFDVSRILLFDRYSELCI